MRILQGFCEVCETPFTAYLGECVVVRGRARSLTHRGAERLCHHEKGCHLLEFSMNSTQNQSLHCPEKLSKIDRRVLIALTGDFTSPAQIAVRARIAKRDRALIVEQICEKLTKNGFAELATSGRRRYWRSRYVK